MLLTASVPATPFTPARDPVRRIATALDNRGVALVLADDDPRRTNFLRGLCDRLAAAGEHAPVIVGTPAVGTDAELLRAICSALGLPATRTRAPMWRAVTRYAEEAYVRGRRLLLAIDDLHQASGAHFDVLHSLTTVTVGHDLAIGIVLSGRKQLLARLAEERHGALRSRVYAAVRLNEDDPRVT